VVKRERERCKAFSLSFSLVVKGFFLWEPRKAHKFSLATLLGVGERENSDPGAHGQGKTGILGAREKVRER
jgi:hypothetical protein